MMRRVSLRSYSRRRTGPILDIAGSRLPRKDAAAQRKEFRRARSLRLLSSPLSPARRFVSKADIVPCKFCRSSLDEEAGTFFIQCIALISRFLTTLSEAWHGQCTLICADTPMSPAAILVSFVAAAVSVTSVYTLVRALARAEQGYEDEKGFHHGSSASRRS